MCLDFVDRRVKASREVLEAFKVFGLGADGTLYFPIFSLLSPTNSKAPRGRWLKAKKRTKTTASYTTGFHCFLAKRGADDYSNDFECDVAIVPVRVRGVRLYGEQNGHPALVADELFIPRASK